MTKKQTLYFAYGSNMFQQQMLQRCPSAECIGQAKLKGWRFQYDGTCDDWSDKAVGNIVRSPANEVYGVLYALNTEDIDQLNYYEDYPVDYVHIKVKVAQIPSGEVSTAFVYARAFKTEVGEPSKEYEHTVVRGAQQAGLPDAYIKNLLTYSRPE